MTSFEKIQSRRSANPMTLSKRVSKGQWQTNSNSFASYVSRQPTFGKGTIAANIRQYLSIRKKPATMRDIVTFVQNKRGYKSYDSGRRSVSRSLAQLANWGNVTRENGQFLWNRNAKA